MKEKRIKEEVIRFPISSKEDKELVVLFTLEEIKKVVSVVMVTNLLALMSSMWHSF